MLNNKKLRLMLSKEFNYKNYLNNKLFAIGLNDFQIKEIEKLIHNLPIHVDINKKGFGVGVKIENFKVFVYENKRIINSL